MAEAQTSQLKPFVVTVGGKEYDVDAPDENTAWRWANATHKSAEKKPPLKQIEKNGPGSYPTPLESAAAFPLTQFATKAASLPLAAAEFLPGGAGEFFRQNNQTLKDMTEKGRSGQGEFMRMAGDVYGFGGAAMQPANIAAMKAIPVLSGAATIPGKIAQAAGNTGLGASFGALSNMANPVGAVPDFEAAKLKQAEEGAVFGGLAGLIAPPLVNAASKAVGTVADFITGKMPDVRAAKVLRDVVGNDAKSIRAAAESAPEGLTAAQAAAGVKNDAFDALGELAAKNDKTSYFARLLEQQKQDRINAMRGVAGGASQTEVISNAKKSKDALNKITTPMREAELGAANVAGTTGRALQGEADDLAAAAAAKVDDVRRLTSLGERAANTNIAGQLTSKETAGMPRISGRYGYIPTDLPVTAAKAATKAADDSLILGDAARFAQSRADSVAAAGLKPLDTSAMVARINQMTANPNIGPSDINTKVLNAVAKKIQTWTDNGGGVIDANALYEIRKNTVNEVVEKLMAGADPKSQAKQAASLLARVRPMIDNAVEAAGGTGWRQYLKTYEDGINVINQKKLGAKALEFLEKSPKQFESLVAGNEPKTVKKIFDSEFDVRSAMGGNMQTMDKIASELARDRSIAEGAERGSGALAKILQGDSFGWRIPNLLNPKVTLANRALDVAESGMNKVVMEKIYDAMKSGKGVKELLDTLPAQERIAAIKAMSQMRAATAATVGASSMNRTEQNYDQLPESPLVRKIPR